MAIALEAMNRKQRRQQGITEPSHKKTYNMTEWQVKQKTVEAMQEELAKIRKETSAEVTEKVISAMVIALHDTYGFKRKRLNRWIKKAYSIFSCLDAGTVTLEDLQDECINELKIEL